MYDVRFFGHVPLLHISRVLCSTTGCTAILYLVRKYSYVGRTYSYWCQVLYTTTKSGTWYQTRHQEHKSTHAPPSYSTWLKAKASYIDTGSKRWASEQLSSRPSLEERGAST